MLVKSSSRAKDLAPLLTNARFFVAKATTPGNLKIAKDKSVWSPNVPNELILNEAFARVDNVILFFILDGLPYLQVRRYFTLTALNFSVLVWFQFFCLRPSDLVVMT